jgi:hypothetical protein
MPCCILAGNMITTTGVSALLSAVAVCSSIRSVTVTRAWMSLFPVYGNDFVSTVTGYSARNTTTLDACTLQLLVDVLVLSDVTHLYLNSMGAGCRCSFVVVT